MWVGDLAPMVADGVTDDFRVGATYELGGPEVLTLATVVQQIVGERVVLPVPMPLAALGAAAADLVPWLPVGRDQYRALQHDNVAADSDVSAFGADPERLTSLAAYVSGRSA